MNQQSSSVRFVNKSSEEWSSNQKYIFNVSLKNQGWRVFMNLDRIEDYSVFEFLLKNDRFNYYSLSFGIWDDDEWGLAMEFLSEVKDRNEETGIENR